MSVFWGQVPQSILIQMRPFKNISISSLIRLDIDSILWRQAFPQSVKSGTKFNLKMLWKNSGVAPFRFQWPVEVSFIGLLPIKISMVVSKGTNKRGICLKISFYIA